MRCTFLFQQFIHGSIFDKHPRQLNYVPISLLYISEGGSLVCLIYLLLKGGLFSIRLVATVTCCVALLSIALHRACSQ